MTRVAVRLTGIESEADPTAQSDIIAVAAISLVQLRQHHQTYEHT